MVDENLKNRLKTEAMNPYRGLRQFIYISAGSSAFIGAFIFFFQLLAGRNVASTIPNLGIQLGIVTLMVVLWRWENLGKRVKKQD